MALDTRKTADERKEALAISVTNSIAMGRRVESQSDYQAVLVKGKPVNHVLHLILTLVTAGFWSPIWIALVIFGGEKREVARVDEWGNASIQKL